MVSERFLAELEFVQALANADYLLHLAGTNVLNNSAFVSFISYLWRYWRTPEYAVHLVYPQCLRILELLQDPAFREALKDPRYVAFLKQQQYLHWLYRADPTFVELSPGGDGSAR